MSLKSAPYYWVECDSCGERCEYGDFSALADFGSAIDGALDSEWTQDGQGKHHCRDCEPFCEECKKPAGPLSGERDYLCQECWDKAEAAAAQPAT